ncbi:hypothetical protein Fcan01_17150 [Folsomia candida]|uniref:Uncharacterized protein n=1 Tax=Folsomia candida TaxID=158441 RepID=A0A226DSV6_FOLCA|nr:hypothetical protein Fcan01_17150 [Folsomia candida]
MHRLLSFFVVIFPGIFHHVIAFTTPIQASNLETSEGFRDVLNRVENLPGPVFFKMLIILGGGRSNLGSVSLFLRQDGDYMPRITSFKTKASTTPNFRKPRVQGNCVSNLKNVPRYGSCHVHAVVILAAANSHVLLSESHRIDFATICSPFRNWYFIVTKSMTATLKIPISESPLYLQHSLRAMIRNVFLIMIHPKRSSTFWLVRHKWVIIHESLWLDIKTYTAAQRNFKLESVATMSAYPIAGLYTREVEQSYIRGSKTETPGMRMAYTVIDFVNATLGFPVRSKDSGKIVTRIQPLVTGIDGFVDALTNYDEAIGHACAIERRSWETLQFSTLIISNPVVFLTPLRTNKVGDGDFFKAGYPHASWFFFTFIFTTSYKSCMVSDLITPTVVEPPSTFRELFNSNFNISRTSEFSMESLHELEAHLKSLGISNLDRVTGFRENHHLHECFETVRKKNHACISTFYTVAFLARVVLTDARGKIRLKVSKERIMPTWVGLPMSPFSSLKPYADQVVDRLMASGLIFKWIEIQEGFTSMAGRRIRRMCNSDLTGKAERIQHEKNTEFDESDVDTISNIVTFGAMFWILPFLELGVKIAWVILFIELGVSGTTRSVFVNLFGRWVNKIRTYFDPTRSFSDST